MKLLKDFKLNNKNNMIITAALALVILVVTLITGIQFAMFTRAEVYFYTGGVDEIQKFSQYSRHLKGSIGDSDIFIINGKENTVAVVKEGKANDYNAVNKITSATKVAGVKDSTQLDAAQATLSSVTIAEVNTAQEVISQLNAGTIDVAILSYAEAKAAVASNNGIVIADAEVEIVPSLLVLGGTHPNEPSSQTTSVLFLENARVNRGKLFITTETNKSAFSHSQPQEATAWYYNIETKSGGTRTFKFGARGSNPIHQWPTPDVYTHSSGQQLSSSEVRNINRCYPGSETGTYTERVAYAITQLVIQNDITMVIDLHEASPEYMTINAIISHDDASGIAANASIIMDMGNVEISQQTSPRGLRGLTHRELGDHTRTFAFLCETSNASQGKFRGQFTEELIITGEDKFYKMAEKVPNLIYAAPVHIDERVARHTFSVMAIAEAFNRIGVNRDGVVTGAFLFDQTSIPSYDDIMDNGLGYYLKDQPTNK